MKEFRFRYGDGEVMIPLDERQVLGELHGNHVPAAASIPDTLRAALENPIDLPPLKQWVRPGERVALVVSDMSRFWMRQDKVIPPLVDMGIFTGEGKVVKSMYDKFRQINRFLEFIEDILPALSREREVTILDFGCGKSYLTFAMYYYLKELKKYDVHIIGLDLKEDVIRKCNGLAEKYGYEKLHFLCGDIAEYEGVQKVDMVVTLHACDKATDYALAKAVEWDAQVILSVPRCQHELNDQIQNKLLSPVLKYGLLKERMSALLTDGIRAELLESKGYSTQILEFIDMEHTPKNLLIRAVKTGRSRSGEALKEMTDAIHGHLTLEKLLYPDGFDAKEGV